MPAFTVAFAQSSELESQMQIIKERNATAKLTDKEIEKKAIKEARKQAKALEKDGWKPAPGSLSLDKQLSNLLLKQYEMHGNLPVYIVGKSSARSTSYGMARKQAIARARVEIATNMKAEVASLTEISDANTELSNGEVETMAKMVDTSKQLAQQSIGKTDIVFEAIREKGNVVEVQIGLVYSLDALTQK